MQPALHHECTRVPVTALASTEHLLLAAEGPFIRFYRRNGTHFLATRRVFESQTVHGILIDAHDDARVTRLVVWGGRLIRVIDITIAILYNQCALLDTQFSNVAIASEWIFDLALQPCNHTNTVTYDKRIVAAVTARNALLRITMIATGRDQGNENSLTVSTSPLTADTLSTLYSAHLFWNSPEELLIAAGTAFGEVIYWSWNCGPQNPISRVHKIFVGHEGSVFGVQISGLTSTKGDAKPQRVLASCSDDRTIRIWNISLDASEDDLVVTSDDQTEAQRARHTGFINATIDSHSFTDTYCLAVGWGHTSRVWKIQFLDLVGQDEKILLLSAGEDATTRSWQLVSKPSGQTGLPYQLLELGSTGHHNGKNVWSTTVFPQPDGSLQVFCGGADSKITTYPLIHRIHTETPGSKASVPEYSITDILSMARSQDKVDSTNDISCGYRSSKRTEFLRGYCFLKEDSVMLTTNFGRILLAHIQTEGNGGKPGSLSRVDMIDSLPELSGYSICVSEPSVGVVFLAGSKGDLFMYSHSTTKIVRVLKAASKIGDILISRPNGSHKLNTLSILVTQMGQKRATFMQIDAGAGNEATVLRSIDILISEHLTGSTISSMTQVDAMDQQYLLVGFRKGSVALYNVTSFSNETQSISILDKVLEKIHGDETVTALVWVPSESLEATGHLYSIGRDGRQVIHDIDLRTNSITLVHSLALPIGPNVESFYFHGNHLLVHGFSSKKWILYDITAEEEVMNVETGGAHRSWAFHPRPSSDGGAALVWTRASSMQICSQAGPNHKVIRSGGHGREIKAVAVAPLRLGEATSGSLIATGAEDTDIKIFQYVDGDLLCRSTLRKHTTGIQHLQWSEDSNYLFSSGGCEEFYIWRICPLRSYVQIGVICEHAYEPESEDADLRIMSFDVVRQDAAYRIALAFSDSSVKVYKYSPASAVRWQPIAKGSYFTSCLTQCIFLSPTLILTAGTDGYAVFWALTPESEDKIVNGRTSCPRLDWGSPIKIHQNASKTISFQVHKDKGRLIVSGGDDGSLAFLFVEANALPGASTLRHIAPAMRVNCTHGSAVTACTVVPLNSRIFILTCGNDEWVRLWEVLLHDHEPSWDGHEYTLDIRHVKKIKTNIADVSSMTIIEIEDRGLSSVRVLLCGVGMEVVRIEFRDAGT